MLFRSEGVQITSSITTLDDVLEISDDTAERIMPYGLAAEFARADRNENVRDTYSYKYNSLIRTIRMDEEDITDVYNVLDGL